MLGAAALKDSIVSVILPCYIESDTLKSASWIYTYLPVAAMPLMLDIYSTLLFNLIPQRAALVSQLGQEILIQVIVENIFSIFQNLPYFLNHHCSLFWSLHKLQFARIPCDKVVNLRSLAAARLRDKDNKSLDFGATVNLDELLSKHERRQGRVSAKAADCK